MTLPNQIAAYEDCFILYDKALADPLGARALFDTKSKARVFIMRMHQARQLERDESKKQYPKEDPRWGKSEYDSLRVTLREGDPSDGWWVYVDRHSAEILAMETLSQDDLT